MSVVKDICGVQRLRPQPLGLSLQIAPRSALTLQLAAKTQFEQSRSEQTALVNDSVEQMRQAMNKRGTRATTGVAARMNVLHAHKRNAARLLRHKESCRLLENRLSLFLEKAVSPSSNLFCLRIARALKLDCCVCAV
eukprot:6205040-Pleurochrysis_carterae.AAC.1